jgi:hypothetical protein
MGVALDQRCAFEPGAIGFGMPWMNSQTSGWRSCQARNSSSVFGQSVAGAASRSSLRSE